MVCENFLNLSEEDQKETDWCEAVSCAIQIELYNYADLLDFQPKYILGKGCYCIDLLIIKNNSTQMIPKNITHIFKTYNLFKIKEPSSPITINDYYATFGYACLLCSQLCNLNKKQYSSLDTTITLLAFRYPQELITHLQNERKLTIKKISSGIYHIDECTLKAQIIVINQLSLYENLYLNCLAGHFKNSSIINRLSDDYTKYKNLDIYTKYLNWLTTANFKAK